MERIACLLLSALALSPVPALAGARQNAVVTLPSDPEERKQHEDFGFAGTLRYGDTLYVSGIVADVFPGETLEQGYVRAYDRLDKILKAAGSSWDDVVDLTTFHTDVVRQLPVLAEVQKRYVKPPYPAWVAVGTTRLIPNYGVTEFKIVARIEKPAAGKPAK